MLLRFFDTLRKQGVPVSIGELLDLLEALLKNVVFADNTQFYYLSRACLVKDEALYDKFDRAFQLYFGQLTNIDDILASLIPEQWIRDAFSQELSQEQKEKVRSLGGLEALMEAFKERLEEQKERHQGGNKWIGTGGTSPFGNGGYHPEGIRVGGIGGGGGAVKVWEKRQYQDLDDNKELGARNIKMALRRLRKFTRTSVNEEFDLQNTIRSTADNAGMLDIQMRPERQNSSKVLLWFDVGGSMDPYVQYCESLFSAARSEFKHMEYFYFHNFIYDEVWQDNKLRYQQGIATYDILRKYSRDFNVIIVGDAAMATYEITHVGGAIDFHNQEPGQNWLQRIVHHFDNVVWLNPIPESQWQHAYSTQLIQQMIEQQMYPLTLKGMERAMRELSR